MDVSSKNTLWFLLSCLVAPQVAKETVGAQRTNGGVLVTCSFRIAKCIQGNPTPMFSTALMCLLTLGNI